MIKKRLQFIYEIDGYTHCIFFNSWKEIHMYLFENGLYREFQVTGQNGEQLLHYKKISTGIYDLKWSEKVPGSVVFEIVNKHASAKL